MGIRVLIVDDSALVRQVLRAILESADGFEVVGAAADPYQARELIKRHAPDVLTLDVEMPRMDGLTFLDNLMRLRPMPVLMVSSLTERGAEVTLQALEIGAVDCIAKPKLDIAAGLQAYADELCAKLRVVAAAQPRGRRPGPVPADAGSVVSPPRIRYRTTDKLIAVGASTGGTEAIRALLADLPADSPALVIAQHIPAMFSLPFARRMDSCSAVEVCEARDGQPVIPGHAYIAPGDRHLTVQRDGARFRCRVDQAPPVNRHRPSVDVLFHSVARAIGADALGVILTGMGRDGAEGLRAMRDAGALTLAQDRESSVVWGMPGAAVQIEAAERQLPLEQIAGACREWARCQRTSG